MPRIRRSVIVALLAPLVLGLGIINASPAAAADFAVSAPASDNVWFTGETRTITWTVDDQVGTYTLELWSTGGSAAKLATIGTGADVTTGSYRWTIPIAMDALVQENLAVRVVPAAGGPAVSASFDLRRSGVSNVNICQWAHGIWQLCRDQFDILPFDAGITSEVFWGLRGETGPTVKIELVRTAGDVTTRTILAKSEPNDGQATVMIPKKSVPDTGFDKSYRIAVTPVLAGTVGAESAPMPVRADAVAVGLDPSHGLSDEDVEVEAGAPIQLSWGAPSRPEHPRVVKVEAKPASGKPTLIRSGDHPGLGYSWYPSTPGTYDLVATDTKNKKLTSTATQQVIVAANPDVVRQSAPSDATATIGQPITISWGFFDDAEDNGANDIRLPVDIDLVSATGKSTNIAKAFSGTESADFGMWEQSTTMLWRPSAKLAAGSYTIKVKRSDSTVTSDQAITIAQPASIAIDDLESATFEPGELLSVSWTATDGAEVPVNFTLVPSGGKPISLAKKVVATGNEAELTIPATVAAGSYALTIATSDKFGTGKTVLSDTAAVTITAPTITVDAPETIKNGQDLVIDWEYADDSQLPVKLELIKGAATKPAATIAKSAPTANAGDGSFTWTVPATVAAGTDYVVKATVLGPKGTPIADTSDAIALTAPVITVDEDPTSGGATLGQTIVLEWTADSGVDQSVTVSILKGSKVVAKVDAKELTVDGSGSAKWLVGAKLKPGDDYKVRVTDNKAKTVTDDSAVFSVVVGQTALVTP